MRKTCVLKVAAVVLFLSLPVAAQTSTFGTLKGTVTSATGAVDPNAMVLIEHWSKGAYRAEIDASKTARTKGDGSYAIQLPAGIYDIFVSSAGMLPFCKQVKIEPGTETTVSPTLEPAPNTEIIH